MRLKFMLKQTLKKLTRIMKKKRVMIKPLKILKSTFQKCLSLKGNGIVH